MAARDTLEQKVAALGDLPRDQLVTLWRKSFGVDPPRGVHKGLLIRAAAYHLQQKHYGGPSGEAKRLLKLAVKDLKKTIAAKAAQKEGDDMPVAAPTTKPADAIQRRVILPGARLIRDWNGKSHVVDVVDNGFIYAGRRYRSLSKIAGEITGTSWSGPRFFGL